MKLSQKTKSIVIQTAICLAAGLITILLTQDYLFSFGALKTLEQKHIDERFQKRGVINIKDTSQVIIVEITQNTYDGIPVHWPWPRDIYAHVIRNLNKAGARAIGIDLIMSTPDQISALNDSAMFNAIRECKNVVVAGKISIMEGSISKVEMNNGTKVAVEGNAGYTISKEKENYNSVYFPADSSIGIVEMVNDEDGVTRRYLPFRYSPSTDKLIPSFSFAIVNKYYKLPSMTISDITPDYFVLHGHKIPRFDRISMLINFYGPSRTFKYFDFIDVLDDKDFKTKDEIELGEDINTWDDPNNGYLQSGIFKNKIVLIGSTLPEDKDILPIAFAKGDRQGDNLINGVEIHANAIENILSNNFLIKEPKPVEIAIIIFLSFFTFFVTSRFKIRFNSSLFLELFNLIIIAAMLTGVRALSLYVFTHYNILASIMSANMAIVLGYLGSLTYRLVYLSIQVVTERRQKGMIKGMFSQYVNATVVDELIGNPDSLKLGGLKRDISVFFSDIESFTTISESLSPEDLITFLNEYLTEMTDIIFKNNGTLDKYIGDAVMAFWGAPVPLENHKFLACKTSLEMKKRLAELRIKWISENKIPINFRIGLNAGDTIVGNVGGSQRFDYTIIGDTVNLASRLEGANKEYGTRILISESIYDSVKDSVVARELDILVVKGRTKPIRVYELIALKEETLMPELVNCLSEFEKGYALYRRRSFVEAAGHFKAALTFIPDDGPALTYIKRCEMLQADPPPADWDGVFHMTYK
jgi:adenylate cyclase